MPLNSHISVQKEEKIKNAVLQKHMICICIPVFIGFLFETTYRAKILFVEHEIHNSHLFCNLFDLKDLVIDGDDGSFYYVFAERFVLFLMGVRVLGELLVEKLVNNRGDIGRVFFISLDPDLVPPRQDSCIIVHCSSI